MLREQAPGLSEESLAAAMGAPPSASTSSAQLSQLSQQPTAHRPTAPSNAPNVPPNKANGAVPMEVSITFPTQSLDTLQYTDHDAAALSPSPVPTDESPRAHSHDDPSSGGIVIHEKYHDLFITPPIPPMRHNCSEEEDMQSVDTPRSVNTPQPTPASADDDSFYPEDDPMGVSV